MNTDKQISSEQLDELFDELPQQAFDISAEMGESPNTLMEAITRGVEIIKRLDPEFFAFMSSLTEDDFTITLHHGLGQHMRNYWGLWSQDSGVYNEINTLFGLTHGDDCSSVITSGIYRLEQGELNPSDLQTSLQDVADVCHEHWRKIEESKGNTYVRTNQ